MLAVDGDSEAPASVGVTTTGTPASLSAALLDAGRAPGHWHFRVKFHCIANLKVRFRPEPGSRRFFGLRAELGSAPASFTWQIPSHKGT